MDLMPKEVENALKTVMDFVSGEYGAIEQNKEKEIVTYRNNDGWFVANCSMDSARAVAKDCCKQIISNMVL